MNKKLLLLTIALIATNGISAMQRTVDTGVQDETKAVGAGAGAQTAESQGQGSAWRQSGISAVGQAAQAESKTTNQNSYLEQINPTYGNDLSMFLFHFYRFLGSPSLDMPPQFKKILTSLMQQEGINAELIFAKQKELDTALGNIDKALESISIPLDEAIEVILMRRIFCQWYRATDPCMKLYARVFKQYPEELRTRLEHSRMSPVRIETGITESLRKDATI